MSSQPSSPKQQRKQSTPRVVSSPLRPTTPPSATSSRPTSPRQQPPHSLPVPHGSAPKSRARDLLRKHYGLGVGPPPPLPGNQNDPMNMDSVAFDAKSYYDQLITTSTLPTLIKREFELLSEIRQLDSERQSLVYNHHHELIAARDTIAVMKSQAEALEGDLDMLKAAFSDISRLATEVSINRPTSTEANAAPQ
ncbi:Vps51/Vps67-domain-containing protein [Pisolithus orientalis]|uniref:Vps51/Vps67-domain-containing protein n=1 Tax=Pisolithus orientalis TaxID=936130 RepID=UPI0022252BAA|nr:Vps51/Vps67-domain-containing protein [Pisolithus orientalis]KAI6025925.1 Vps51/Vps67-domain-containing protein [Pisolithus orientalis]